MISDPIQGLPSLESQQLMNAFAAFTQASEELQKKYEALHQQLGHLQNELQTVIEAVPFGIWVLGEKGELRFSNRPTGMKGHFQDGPPPWGAESPNGVRRFMTEEGQERVFEQEMRPTSSGRVITLRDITEAHLKAQQASREARLQAMGLMAAELAHEIRNPLGSLALFSGMLVEDLQAQPDQLDLAQRMQESVARLNTLVTNTLTFSRDINPKPSLIYLHDFIEEARKACLRMEDGLSWENRIPSNATWYADPGLLRQVAVNLIQNATRALEGRPKPRISVTAHPEEVEGAIHVHLILEDNGCGIPEEALSRVFDPFFTTFGGGTGLGLAVSHRILMAHPGGLLYLESQADQGTRVHLRLASTEPGGG